MNYLSGVQNETFLMLLTRNLILLYQKNVRLNYTHYFIMKTPTNKKLHLIAIERQQVAFNHSSGIEFQNFANLYKKFTAKPYSF